MKISPFLILLAAALCISGCSTATQNLPRRGAGEMRFEWFHAKLAEIRKLDQRTKVSQSSLKAFVQRNGAGPFTSTRDQQIFEQKKRELTASAETLTRAVREYNARVDAELQVLFAREGLPMKISMEFTVEAVPAPSSKHPAGANRL